MVEDMTNEAGAGSDVEEIIRRRAGRPLMGSAAASVESVRLDPELKRELVRRAAQDHVSVSEAIRRAVREYLLPRPRRPRQEPSRFVRTDPTNCVALPRATALPVVADMGAPGCVEARKLTMRQAAAARWGKMDN
jgi:hypothetical protein